MSVTPPSKVTDLLSNNKQDTGQLIGLKILRQESILEIIRDTGWPDAKSISKGEELTSGGWFGKLIILLGSFQSVKKVPGLQHPEGEDSTQKMPGQKSTLSDRQAMPPPPRPTRFLHPRPAITPHTDSNHDRTSPLPPRLAIASQSPLTATSDAQICIRISHLTDSRSAQKFMDDWIGTFSNQQIFTSCKPPLGDCSLRHYRGIYWVHGRYFIQIRIDHGGNSIPLGNIQDIAERVEALLCLNTYDDTEQSRPSEKEFLQSTISKKVAAPPTQPRRHLTQNHFTYPLRLQTFRNATFTINMPFITHEIFPELDPEKCTFRIGKIEHRFVGTARPFLKGKPIPGGAGDGIKQFSFWAWGVGRDVITFLIGDKEGLKTIRRLEVEVEVELDVAPEGVEDS